MNKNKRIITTTEAYLNLAHHQAFSQGMQELRSLFRERFRPYDDNGMPRQFYCSIYKRWRDFEYETWCEIDSAFDVAIKEEEEVVEYWNEKVNEEDK